MPHDPCPLPHAPAQLYLFQYPLRPAWRPYGLEERCQEIRVRPLQSRVEVDLAIDTTDSSYDHDSADNLKQTTQTLTSSQLHLATNYAVGMLQGDQLHLNPLHAVVQLRPSLDYLDSAATDKAEGEILICVCSPSGAAAAVTILHLNPLHAVVQLRPSLDYLDSAADKAEGVVQLRPSLDYLDSAADKAEGGKGKKKGAGEAAEEEEMGDGEDGEAGPVALEVSLKKRETEEQEEMRLQSYAHIHALREKEYSSPHAFLHISHPSHTPHTSHYSSPHASPIHPVPPMPLLFPFPAVAAAAGLLSVEPRGSSSASLPASPLPMSPPILPPVSPPFPCPFPFPFQPWQQLQAFSASREEAAAVLLYPPHPFPCLLPCPALHLCSRGSSCRCSQHQARRQQQCFFTRLTPFHVSSHALLYTWAAVPAAAGVLSIKRGGSSSASLLASPLPMSPPMPPPMPCFTLVQPWQQLQAFSASSEEAAAVRARMLVGGGGAGGEGGKKQGGVKKEEGAMEVDGAVKAEKGQPEGERERVEGGGAGVGPGEGVDMDGEGEEAAGAVADVPFTLPQYVPFPSLPFPSLPFPSLPSCSVARTRSLSPPPCPLAIATAAFILSLHCLAPASYTPPRTPPTSPLPPPRCLYFLLAPPPPPPQRTPLPPSVWPSSTHSNRLSSPTPTEASSPFPTSTLLPSFLPPCRSLSRYYWAPPRHAPSAAYIQALVGCCLSRSSAAAAEIRGISGLSKSYLNSLSLKCRVACWLAPATSAPLTGQDARLPIPLPSADDAAAASFPHFHPWLPSLPPAFSLLLPYLDSLPLERRLLALLSRAKTHIFQFDRLMNLLPAGTQQQQVLALLQHKALLVQVRAAGWRPAPCASPWPHLTTFPHGAYQCAAAALLFAPNPLLPCSRSPTASAVPPPLPSSSPGLLGGAQLNALPRGPHLCAARPAAAAIHQAPRHSPGACRAPQGWEFAEPTDQAFLDSHPAIAKEQLRRWMAAEPAILRASRALSLASMADVAAASAAAAAAKAAAGGGGGGRGGGGRAGPGGGLGAPKAGLAGRGAGLAGRGAGLAGRGAGLGRGSGGPSLQAGAVAGTAGAAACAVVAAAAGGGGAGAAGGTVGAVGQSLSAETREALPGALRKIFAQHHVCSLPFLCQQLQRAAEEQQRAAGASPQAVAAAVAAAKAAKSPANELASAVSESHMISHCHMVPSSHIVTWCHPLTLSHGAILSHCHMVPSSHIVTWCHPLTLSHGAILSHCHMVPSSHIVTWEVVIALLRAKGAGGVGLKRTEIVEATRIALKAQVPAATYQRVSLPSSLPVHCISPYSPPLFPFKLNASILVWFDLCTGRF
ncbi:unnamed protein product [Closterium sp. NIES-64]|nr:unnamed protein product [Closterium sp. NIES-64]